VQNGTSHLYYASHYFDFMYRAAEALVQAGLAYVDEQTPEQMRANRGDFNTPGTDSPFRSRTPAENLARLREMRDGQHADGAWCCAPRSTWRRPTSTCATPRCTASSAPRTTTPATLVHLPDVHLRAPDRGRAGKHHPQHLHAGVRGPAPLLRLAAGGLADQGLLARPLPRQHEFGRLNLSYVITSKRKLRELVDEGIVSGWDDPRMPTIFGMRRRGYTPASIREMADGTGASKTNIWLDYAVLEGCLRADLEGQAPRAMAVLDPLPLKLTNWSEVFGSASHIEPCQAPAHPQHPELGLRQFGLGPQVWIERDDFAEVPAKGFFQALSTQGAARRQHCARQQGAPEVRHGGRMHRLREGRHGRRHRVLAAVCPTPRAARRRGRRQGQGHHHLGRPARRGACHRGAVRPPLHRAQPDAGGRDFREVLNPRSKQVVTGYVEPALAAARQEQRYQFERHGYFVADRIDHALGKPVFNRITTLRDSWSA
jgi:glutaminyl-tRNA synthetase